MQLSENGARLIAEFEGVYLKRYSDPVGHCTVGIGHLLHYGPCDGRAGEFDLASEREAWQLLYEDVNEKYGPAVERLITVALNQHQFDALVSFTLNVGYGEDGLAGSTLRKRLNTGDYASVRSELMRWNKARDASGRLIELPGLTRRRAAEADLFDTPAGPAPSKETWIMGTEFIHLAHSGLVVAAEGGAKDNGTHLVQARISGDSYKLWTYEAHPNGGHYIVPAHAPTKCIDADQGGDIHNVVLWERIANPWQSWAINRVGLGLWVAINRHTGKVLDLLGGPEMTALNARLGQYDWIGNANQLFLRGYL